ncbi:MAG: GNAT family N-acetyltransferase [Desulfurococcaceae archaeon]
MSSNEFTIKHTSQIIYTRLSDNSKAYVKYEIENGIMKLLETYTPPQHRGKGIATLLIRYAIDLARKNNLLIKPICSYSIYYFINHPEDRDILVPEYRDLGDQDLKKLFEDARAREREKKGD